MEKYYKFKSKYDVNACVKASIADVLRGSSLGKEQIASLLVSSRLVERKLFLRPKHGHVGLSSDLQSTFVSHKNLIYNLPVTYVTKGLKGDERRNWVFFRPRPSSGYSYFETTILTSNFWWQCQPLRDATEENVMPRFQMVADPFLKLSSFYEQDLKGPKPQSLDRWIQEKIVRILEAVPPSSHYKTDVCEFITYYPYSLKWNDDVA